MTASTAATLGTLVAQLRRHQPATPRETVSLRHTLRYLAWLPRPLDAEADPVHVTGSAMICDGAGRVVLHRHKRLGLWLQPGGHVDPGETPAQAAQREAREETGLALTPPGDGGPPLVHVDVHEGGRGHLHLDLRYLLLGDPAAPFAPADGESPEVRWVPVDEVAAWGDASVADAVAAAVRWAGQGFTGR